MELDKATTEKVIKSFLKTCLTFCRSMIVASEVLRGYEKLHLTLEWFKRCNRYRPDTTVNTLFKQSNLCKLILINFNQKPIYKNNSATPRSNFIRW